MTESSKKTKVSFVADSLATGMMVMLAMTIVQRGFGFFRGIWFCRLLDDATVGQWSLANDFITMITPVMLLGIPGSLPRYVEHFRLRGHLPAFVRRLLTTTIVLGTMFIALILALPQWFGWLVFLESQNLSLIYAVAVGVLAIIGFNFVYQLVSSLRQVRVASMMQFAQSVGFTLIGVTWLTTGGGIVGLVYSFVAATVIAIVPGMISLVAGWSGLPESEEVFDTSAMWKRLLPYAAALWAMNLLTNLFAMSDRFMILHMLPGSEWETQAAVGQYHSGRIIPVLLISLATMVSGVLLPYLTADWEAGRREEVRGRLRRILMGVTAVFTCGAAVALWLAPWCFSTLLEGRYSKGLDLMPMAFVFCIWVSLATVAQDYLWVSERGKWVAMAIFIGLVANVLLNIWLMPMWGLAGAVFATLAANGIVLLGIWFAMSRFGFQLDQTTYYVTVLPLTLLAGPGIAIACVLIACLSSEQIRYWCRESLSPLLARFNWLGVANPSS